MIVKIDSIARKLMREKKFPSFHNVFEIDLTDFDGDFVVKESGLMSYRAVEITATGKRRKAVDATEERLGGGTILHVTAGGNVKVGKTGGADASPGGFANSGVVTSGGGRRGKIVVRNTGNATAGPGGSANSGYAETPREVVKVTVEDTPCERRSGADVMVEIIVQRGTKVKYCN